VTALCAPLLRHYGFPLRARASEGGAHLERGAVVGAPPEE
jgi:hypothetical protein